MGGWNFIKRQPEKIHDVLVALCVHRGVDPSTWFDILGTALCPNPKMHVRFESGDALIDRARGKVATRFLERPEYEVLMFIDDDILFDPLDAVLLAKDVYEGGFDIVGGAYVKKQKTQTNLAIKLLDDNKALKFGKEGGIYECRMVSTGFMAISRRVIEEMVKREVVHKCAGDFYPFFMPEERFMDGYWNYLSEDWAFCERARDLGFKVHVDTRIMLKHAGRYEYDQDDMLKSQVPGMKSFDYWEKDCKAQVLRTDFQRGLSTPLSAA